MRGDVPTHLGRMLRERRLEAGLTQLDLATSAGVSIGVVRDLEQGLTSRLQAKSINRLATALRLHPGQLSAAPPAHIGAPGRGQTAGTGRPGDRVALPPGTPHVAPGLRIRVLGPVGAWLDGQPVPLGPPMQQAVLAMLAVEPGAVLRRETISEVLWGADPPPTSTAMIQTYISRLRHVLALGRNGLSHHCGPGYRLQADSAHVDAVEFTQLARRAQSALDVGAAAEACQLSEQALGLWQGEAAAGLDALRTYSAITRLDSLWAASILLYARACTVHGWHELAIPYLRELGERDPLNERACACLMIALAACGQQAAALAAYDQMCHELDDQLGIRPGPELADTHLRVLRNLVPGPLTLPAPRSATSRSARDPSPVSGLPRG